MAGRWPSGWIFAGDPADSRYPLLVAVARLLGYRWLRQKPGGLDALCDRDGTVCVPSVGGERPAAEDLQDRLKLILRGEPPHDIFVRWKPLEEQPIGWDPDLNDGVRINICPFITAGVLRKNPRIKWKKDRGKEPERDREQFPWFWEGGELTGARVNDVHLTLAEKKAARENTRKK